MSEPKIDQGEQNLLNKERKSWHDTNVRWFVLILACIFQMCSYFSTDYPSVLPEEIKREFNNTQSDVNLLYTYYSMPNIVMPMLGGIFIDVIGIRFAMVGFFAILIIGQLLCYVSALSGNFTVMLIGRFVYGLGGENCVVAQSYIVSKWFFGGELALALGLNITFARVGSILGALLLSNICSWFGDKLSPAMLFCLLMLLVGWADTIGLAVIDKWSDKRDKVEKKIEGDKITLKDIKEFKLDFYLLTLSCLACYSAFFLFQYNNVQMFQTVFHVSKDSANFYYSIPYYGAIILTPVFGFVIDKFGKRTILMIICGILLVVNNLYFLSVSCAEDQVCKVIPIIGQISFGIYYSLYAAVMWPCVPLCVPEKTVGTAFGVVNAVQNIGLAIFPVIVGKIVESETTESYKQMMIFLGSSAIVGLLSNIALYIADRNRGGKMDKPSVKESILENQVEDADISIPPQQS